MHGMTSSISYPSRSKKCIDQFLFDKIISFSDLSNFAIIIPPDGHFESSSRTSIQRFRPMPLPSSSELPVSSDTDSDASKWRPRTDQTIFTPGIFNLLREYLDI